MRRFLQQFAFVSLLAIGFLISGHHAQASGNVVGYAWSDSAGWISMNCDNSTLLSPAGFNLNTCPTGIDYGVNLDMTTGDLTGYAWSDNLGWMSFTPHASPPAQFPVPTAPANINSGVVPPSAGPTVATPGQHEVNGWARFCSDLNASNIPDNCGDGTNSININNGGWNGWVSMKGETQNGDPYAVIYDDTTEDFSGHAWGGSTNGIGAEVTGWISFSGVKIKKIIYICSDGLDNDGDGQVDFPADPGCQNATDMDEFNVWICSDGLDNDGDTKVDYPDDIGCTGPYDLDQSEANVWVCSDNIDNDNDGFIDYALDIGCQDAFDMDEYNVYVCSDGLDNDNDGSIDFPSDLGCVNTVDMDETGPAIGLPICSNNIDDDGDGLIDYPQDPGCSSNIDMDETNLTECSDGLDNDGNGLIDFPADTTGCSSLLDNDESTPPLLPICSDLIDNDNDGKIDFPADPGCLNALDMDETDPPPILYECNDGIDNDLDGAIDWPADPDCTGPTDPLEAETCVMGTPGCLPIISLTPTSATISPGGTTEITYKWQNPDPADPFVQCTAFNDVSFSNPLQTSINWTGSVPTITLNLNTGPTNDGSVQNIFTYAPNTTFMLDCVTASGLHAADPYSQQMPCNASSLQSAINTCPRTTITVNTACVGPACGGGIYTPVVELLASPNPASPGGTTTITYRLVNPDPAPENAITSCTALSDQGNIGPANAQPGGPGTWDINTFFDATWSPNGIPFPTNLPQTQTIGPLNGTTLVYLLCTTAGGQSTQSRAAADPSNPNLPCSISAPQATCPRVLVTVGNVTAPVLEGQGTINYYPWNNNFNVDVSANTQEKIILRWYASSEYTNCVALNGGNSLVPGWTGQIVDPLNASNSYYGATPSGAELLVPDDPTVYRIMCHSTVTNQNVFSNDVTVHKRYLPGALTLEGRLSGSSDPWQTGFQIDDGEEIELRWHGGEPFSNCVAHSLTANVTGWNDHPPTNAVLPLVQASQTTSTPFHEMAQNIAVPNDPTTYTISCDSSVGWGNVTSLPVTVSKRPPVLGVQLRAKPAGAPSGSYTTNNFSVFSGDTIDFEWSAGSAYNNCVAWSSAQANNWTTPNATKASLLGTNPNPFTAEQLAVEVPVNTTTYHITCKKVAGGIPVSVSSNAITVGYTTILPGDIILGGRLHGTLNAFTPAFPVNDGETIDLEWRSAEGFNNCTASASVPSVVGWNDDPQTNNSKPGLSSGTSPAFVRLQNNPDIEVPNDPTSYFITCDSTSGWGTVTSNEVRIIKVPPLGTIDLVGKVDGATNTNATYSNAFQVNQGQTITLEWSSSVEWNSCTANSSPNATGWNNGSLQTPPTSPLYLENKNGIGVPSLQPNTYTITCTNNQGQQTSNPVVVTVNPASAARLSLMIKLDSDPASSGTYGDLQNPNPSVQVPSGDRISLHWESSDPVVPNSCTASSFDVVPNTTPPVLIPANYWPNGQTSGGVGDADVAPVDWNIGGIEAININLNPTSFTQTKYQITCDIVNANGNTVTVSSVVTANALQQNLNAPAVKIAGPTCVKTSATPFDLAWAPENLDLGTCSLANTGNIAKWDIPSSSPVSISGNHNLSFPVANLKINSPTTFTIACTSPSGTVVNDTHTVDVYQTCNQAPRRNWFFRFFER